MAVAPAAPIARTAPTTPAPAPRAGLGAGTIAGIVIVALLVIAAAAFALLRRRRIDEDIVEEESFEPAYAAEEAEPVNAYYSAPEADTAAAAEEQPAIVAPEASAFSWGNAPAEAEAEWQPEATSIPEGFDLSRFGPHVQAAYRGPTEDNPSLSLRHRLRRAAGMDAMERNRAEAEAAERSDSELETA